MLEVRAETAVRGDRSRFVSEEERFRLAVIHNGLDCDHHTFAQFRAVSASSIVRNLGLFVQLRANSMSHEFPDHAETVSLNMLLHCRSHIAHRISNSRLFDSPLTRFFGHLKAITHLRLHRLANRNRDSS